MTELYEQFFATPFFATEKPEWVDKLNKNSQPYLDDAHNNVEEKVKESPQKAANMLELYQEEIVRLTQKIKFDQENGLKPNRFDIEYLHEKQRLLQFLEQEIEEAYGSLDDSD